MSSVPLENSSQTRFFSRERQPRERGAPHPPHMRFAGIVISKTHSILQYMAILPANETLATCSRGRRPSPRLATVLSCIASAGMASPHPVSRVRVKIPPREYNYDIEFDITDEGNRHGPRRPSSPVDFRRFRSQWRWARRSPTHPNTRTPTHRLAPSR